MPNLILNAQLLHPQPEPEILNPKPEIKHLKARTAVLHDAIVGLLTGVWHGDMGRLGLWSARLYDSPLDLFLKGIVAE